MKNPVFYAEELALEINQLFAAYPQLLEDEELLKDTLEGSTQFNEVMDKLLSAMRENESLAEAIASRIGKLRERQTRLTHRAQFMRALIHRLMERSGMKSVALPEGKISVVNTPEKVIVTDEAAIPDAYCKITREPNRTAIKNALKSGTYIPGASLSNGGTTISVR